ncbi:MAG: lipopolysaccharide transport periplasmic protein LptA [Gammaproteobacteria bacterium]|nr:lipopolysaccharide transport periplasmic protein LptA [Gammaproteobacteria bacterium]MBT8149836.1 lipopolysaccharide transport periplasmic protein LptA [Gammaproteobacteria bacterium]NNL10405.1 lipopolysaccharide transport periplasmic protein LptA [Pseudomonadales bacterium]NNM12556.1 lipopolysaccharide transport periplasmic protein LptA [Pseudomonadales bacterium]RZV56465.1 MAG: lipopolysaccharide transport periplasmic protein LptA [Pseudomonadales bacterium]
MRPGQHKQAVSRAALKIACGCLALLLAVNSNAQSSGVRLDSSAPISIEADSAEQDEKLGVTTYKGNVAIVQGSLSIVADLVRIISRTVNDSRVVGTISADGSPAVFTHSAPGSSDTTSARASSIEYLLDEGKIILQRDATLIQQGSSVSGDRIEYFIEEKRVKANANENAGADGSRVRTVITPGAGIIFDDQQP